MTLYLTNYSMFTERSTELVEPHHLPLQRYYGEACCPKFMKASWHGNAFPIGLSNKQSQFRDLWCNDFNVALLFWLDTCIDMHVCLCKLRWISHRSISKPFYSLLETVCTIVATNCESSIKDFWSGMKGTERWENSFIWWSLTLVSIFPLT